MRPDRNERPAGPTGEDSSHGIPADPRLTAEGWVRRHLADPERAEEAVALYTSLGFEVKAQRLTPADLGPGCGGCGETLCSSYLLIYTRKRSW